MIIYPAMDLVNGHCVRLVKGDFNDQTLYNEDPIAQAQGFAASGAHWCHIVDLDGAKDPEQHQRALIQRVMNNTTLRIQTGGGIRTEAQIEQLLEAGCDRVIIGSRAVTQREQVAQWLKQFGPDRLVVALDVHVDPESNTAYCATHGWQKSSKVSLTDLLRFYTLEAQTPLHYLLCTDIDRDGTLEGPNVELYQFILQQFPDIKLQASGGVKDLSSLEALKALPLEGVVIGKALYEKRFTLKEALHHVG